MKFVSGTLILLSALIHLLFFKLESLDFMNPDILDRFGLDEVGAEYVRVWAFNQGFYNLFLALGLLVAFFLLYLAKKWAQGLILALFILMTMVGAGLVLYYSAPQKALAALIQSGPPLLAILSLALIKK